MGTGIRVRVMVVRGRGFGIGFGEIKMWWRSRGIGFAVRGQIKKRRSREILVEKSVKRSADGLKRVDVSKVGLREGITLPDGLVQTAAAVATQRHGW